MTTLERHTMKLRQWELAVSMGTVRIKTQRRFSRMPLVTNALTG